MFETLGFDTLTAPQAALIAALVFGVFFGALAQITQFCFRRALIGEDRHEARAVWLTALAVAVLGTQGAVAAGLIGFGEHRFQVEALPFAAIILGGLAFGAGMILTRGCLSRLTVLSASGNLRALTVLGIGAIAAHATLKGVLAPLRVSLEAITADIGGALPGAPVAWVVLVIALAGWAVAKSGAGRGMLVLAAALGALVPLAWVTTGFVLYDDFDPVAQQAISFTAPLADTLFFTIASSAIAPTFGAALVAGTLAGAFVAALATRRFAWQSFSSPRETGRYALGAVLMGAGGVLAGGCTVGAGLSGLPTLSVAALLAMVAITGGALATHRLLSGSVSGSSAPQATRSPRPAT